MASLKTGTGYITIFCACENVVRHQLRECFRCNCVLYGNSEKNEHLTGFLCFAHSCVPSLWGLSFLPHRAQWRVNCQHVQGQSSSFCIPPYCWANTLNFPLPLLLFSGAFIKLLSYIALCLGPILQLPLHMHNYWILSREPSILELISSGIFCHQQLKKKYKEEIVLVPFSSN